VPKPETIGEIDEYVKKAKSITSYDLAKRFNIRMSIARKILKGKEKEGVIVPYIHESGFVVYTTPAEIEKREGGKPIMLVDVLEEIASSAVKRPVISTETDIAPSAASAAESAKPGKHARQRRALDDRKEKEKARQPEIVVEPLEDSPTAEAPKPEVKKPKKKVTPKKVETKPKKKVTPKKAEAKPKKKVTAKKAEAKPKKKVTKKKAETKPKKKVTKKKAETAPKKKTP